MTTQRAPPRLTFRRPSPQTHARGATRDTKLQATAIFSTDRVTSFRLGDALKVFARHHAHFLEVGIIRTIEFVSSLRRMSFIVKRLRSSSIEVHVTGAPEVMEEICDKDSFSDDYDDMLSYHTKRGYRVIAMASKSIENLSWFRAQKMKREQAESGLKFLGMIIFENKLKPRTAPAIQALRDAHFACRMTGDNPLTAVSAVRECGLVDQAAHVFSLWSRLRQRHPPAMATGSSPATDLSSALNPRPVLDFDSQR